MERSNKIAILGGSFNPIHCGHIYMAEQAHFEYGFENIIVMPNKTTYYKENKVFVADEHRINMIKLAMIDHSYMSCSDMEIKRGGVTHTIDTIREFKNLYPGIKPYFIIGGDSLEWIDKWVEADELLESMIVLTAVRGKTDKARSESIIHRIMEMHPNAELHILCMEEKKISSSDIRERVTKGLSIAGLVPEAVEEYIIQNGLYKN